MAEDHREQAADVDPLLTQSDQEVAVFYETSTELLSFSGRTDSMKEGPEDSENEASGTVDEYTTVLLGNGAAGREGPCCSLSYRSADPDRSVTPFAVILLIVLFGVYILNQADRLVLPVAIPSGLRCEGAKENCRNLSSSWEPGYSVAADNADAQYSTIDSASNVSNSSSNDTDCISFNDYEQGLLTGRFVASSVSAAGIQEGRGRG